MIVPVRSSTRCSRVVSAVELSPVFSETNQYGSSGTVTGHIGVGHRS